MKRCIWSFLIFCCGALHAQTFDWAVSAGSNGDDKALGIDVDANGNSYVTGLFSGTMVMGSYTLTSVGGTDVFIAKYNTSGNVIWAQSEGGVGNDEADGISVDALGHVAITGLYQNTATFGTTTLSAASGFFVSVYDYSGNFLWAREFGSANGGYAWDVDVDPTGHPVITGYFTGTETFGTTTLTSSGLKEVFILRYDEYGNFNWAISMGGTVDDVAYAVNTDNNGSIYATGRYDGTANFGSYTVSTAGGNDIFLVKVDSTGSVQWVASAGSCPGNDSGQGVDVDASGNVTITGYIALGTAAFGTTYLTSNGLTDCFVARYFPNGTLQWAKNYGGAGDDYGSDLSLSVSGAIFVTGYYSNTVTLGSSTLTSAGGRDVLLMRVDILGNAQYALSGGGSGQEYGRSVAAAGGYVYIDGPFDGNGIYAPISLTNNGMSDIFVARIKDNEVGIDEAESTSFKIYPNPAHQLINVVSAATDNYSVAIFDATGRVVYCSAILQGMNSIDVSFLPAGSYTLSIEEADGTGIRRQLIIE